MYERRGANRAVACASLVRESIITTAAGGKRRVFILGAAQIRTSISAPTSRRESAAARRGQIGDGSAEKGSHEFELNLLSRKGVRQSKQLVGWLCLCCGRFFFLCFARWGCFF